MESRRLGNRAIARATAIAVVLAALLIALDVRAPAAAQPAAAPAQQGGTPICTIDPSCGCTINCSDEGPGGGTPGNPPPPTEPPGGGSDPTPPPPSGSGTPQPTRPPLPTPTPFNAEPGRYVYACIQSGADGLCACGSNSCRVTLWQTNTGEVYVVSAVCVESCSGPTPTPGTQPTPVVDPYPCLREPSFGGGVVSQPCENGPEWWPGWNLSVSVKIPPVNAARYPWPRALVGLENTICFIGAPDAAERFSDGTARPCSIDRGEHEEAGYDCGTFEAGEGDRVNYKLAVAWRRYTGAGNPFPGAAQPGSPSALILEDREWNGGAQVLPISPGQCTTKVYETSSWGLDETFPKWNEECQDRECEYVARTQEPGYSCEACDNCACANCSPAYAAPVQTWWWPEWTWRYDEYQCVRRRDECQSWPGFGTAACDLDGDGSDDPDTKLKRVCEAWAWRDVIEPWRKYDMRQQGLPSPFWRSTRTNYAGMDENRRIRTPFVYPPSVPAIEVQPVAP